MRDIYVYEARQIRATTGDRNICSNYSSVFKCMRFLKQQSCRRTCTKLSKFAVSPARIIKRVRRSHVADSLASSGGFVALFGIVGFRSLRKKIGTDGLYQLFDRSIRPGISARCGRTGKSITLEGEAYNRVRIRKLFHGRPPTDNHVGQDRAVIASDKTPLIATNGAACRHYKSLRSGRWCQRQSTELWPL